jgi:hypothetical protein
VSIRGSPKHSAPKHSVFILHPTPLIHSHRCGGQAGEHTVPRPMLTGAGLRLRDGRTADKVQTSAHVRTAGRATPQMPFALSAFDTRLSTHLRSIRKSLDVPAPSGEHPSGPIARRPPWAPRSFGAGGAKAASGVSRAAEKKHPSDTDPSESPRQRYDCCHSYFLNRRGGDCFDCRSCLAFISIKESAAAQPDCSNLLKTAPPHNCLPLGRVVFFDPFRENGKRNLFF